MCEDVDYSRKSCRRRVVYKRLVHMPSKTSLDIYIPAKLWTFVLDNPRIRGI